MLTTALITIITCKESTRDVTRTNGRSVAICATNDSDDKTIFGITSEWHKRTTHCESLPQIYPCQREAIQMRRMLSRILPAANFVGPSAARPRVKRGGGFGEIEQKQKHSQIGIGTGLTLSCRHGKMLDNYEMLNRKGRSEVK